LALFSGTAAFVLSLFAKWLPGANGRFDDDVIIPASQKQSSLPRRPRRYFVAATAACIFIRFEVFARVTYDLQCSKPGIGAFLPLIVVVYEQLSRRRTSAFRDDYDDISKTMFDDIHDWIAETLVNSPALLILSAVSFSCGTYFALLPSTRSTFFCSSSDGAIWVVSLQILGVLLDSAIVVMLWRILAWARGVKTQLRLLGSALLAASAMMGLSLTFDSLLLRSDHLTDGVDSLYVFDVATDSFIFSIFVNCAALYLADCPPSSLLSTITVICGLSAVSQKVLQIGSFTQVSRSGVLFPLYLICSGFTTFLYQNDMRYVSYIRRIFLIAILLVLVITIPIVAFVKNQTMDAHPLRQMIYSARIEQDRWLTHATVSKSLAVACREYRDRHHGREPPPGFDEWFKYATDRKSVIMDHFEQIRNDLLPFWGIQPSQIREDLTHLEHSPWVVIIRVAQGRATSSPMSPEQPLKLSVESLVERINKFAMHLPEMHIAINMDNVPRAIAPWADTQRLSKVGKQPKSKVMAKISANVETLKTGLDELTREGQQASPGSGVPAPLLTATQFRHLVANACPPGSAARSGYHWNMRDVCLECLKPHSNAQYVQDWLLSTDICHQTDMLRMHGLFMHSAAHKPFESLVPIFSRFKSGGFTDILIPMDDPIEHRIRPIEKRWEDVGLDFNMKGDSLYWRGYLAQVNPSHGILHGGQQERLAHLANNATAHDQVTMVLPVQGNKEKFAYEAVSAREVNAALPIDFGFKWHAACAGAASHSMQCMDSIHEFGSKPEGLDPLAERYVMLADTDTAPPSWPTLLSALRSTSIPFVATIFTQWYPERLTPWLHFVPVDVRFHALHSTLAYFTGLRGRGRLNGRDPEMNAAVDDARWIAAQGSRWADRAIRREDADIYLFRLLLEWGRLVDDRRDELAFRVEDESS